LNSTESAVAVKVVVLAASAVIFNSILYFNVLYQQPNGQLQIQHKQTK
jgi:hypothetical protein